MAKNTITTFGQKVKDALKQKGMTQRDLVEQLGITKQYLYNILFGMSPGSKYLPKIAEICEIDMADLENDTEDSDKTWEPFEGGTEPVDEIWMDTPKTSQTEEEQMEPIQLPPFGVRVVEVLDRKGMKQVDLAREIGTSKQYLYMILHGNRSGRKYLTAIAKICEIDLELATEDTKKTRKPVGKAMNRNNKTKADIQEIPGREENAQ